EALAQRVESIAGGLQQDMLRESPLAEEFLGLMLCFRLNHPRKYGGHFGLRNVNCSVVSNSSHHREPASRVVREPRLTAANLAVHAERESNIGRFSHHNPVKFRRSDTYDAEGGAVEPEGSADRARIHAESALPERITDDGDRPGIPVDFLIEGPADDRGNAEDRIVVTGDLLRVHNFR